jgi:pimeloyl-ACP methyl ester carboxylesterase
LPYIKLAHSPLAGEPTEIHYRQRGSGVPLIFLHGGWGYEIYPLSEAQVSMLGVQVIIPDRSGYGRSGKQAVFDAGFHRSAAAETLALMDGLGLEKCMLSGHSDGAVIAAWMGITAPERCHGLILEAFHYYRVKPDSLGFFTRLAQDPDSLGERAVSILSHDHGEEHWRAAVRGDCEAWMRIVDATDPARPDLYDGLLSGMRMPVALIHGECDPRTEPGELDEVRRELPSAEIHIIAGAEHSPHSSRASHQECARIVRELVTRWLGS